MGVSVAWHNTEKTAIQLTFIAPWTWADYECISPDITALLDSVTHQVDIRVNLSKAGRIPDDAMFRLRESYADLTPNLGDYVFVGAPDELKTLIGVADRYYTALGGSLAFSFA